MSERRPAGSRALAAVAALLAVFLAAGVWGDAPLTTTDVVRFLNAGISERTILSELQGRGFSEPLTNTREGRIREAGGTETLMVAIRRVAPPPPEPAAPKNSGSTAQGLPGLATFAAKTRTVRVPVSVLDKSGQPVLGLKADNFRVSDEGKQQAVTLFSGERRPLRIALALDVSGSMKTKIRQVEAALRYFTDLLEPEDEIMVITFSARVHVLQHFTSDREQLARVLDMLEPLGPTALYDAAAEAIRRVATDSAESKAVVLVSDGVDTDSGISFGLLRELARRSEVPVFSIALDAEEIRDVRGGGGSGINWPRIPGIGIGRPPGGGGGGRGRPPGGGGGGWGGPGGGGPSGGGPGGRRGYGGSSGFDAGPLQELAEETGGRCVIVRGLEHYSPGEEMPGSTPLKAAVESIATTLRHRYLVGYEPPEGSRGWRSIRVDVDRPASTARARKGYYSG